MRIALSILGVLFILIGLVWILQGFNILLGSMMSGHLIYALLGLVVAVIGVALMVYANRRSRVISGGDRPKLDR